MQIPLLKEIVLILALAVGLSLLLRRFKMPTILGFLATGAIFGPHGFGLVPASHEVELLAEVGVIFLLFVIGIEFSLKSLATLGAVVFVGGGVQVVGTTAATALFARLWGIDWPSAIFLGFLFSLSSTAIVLKLLQDKGSIGAPHGRVISAMLIFQDVIVVPMILVTPMLAGRSDDMAGDLFALAGKMIILLILVYVLARYVVPWVLDIVVRTRSRELFIASIVVICFSTAWLTSSIGLSLALGAFFAGLIISESEHRFQATGNVLPFHEVFISFFFVSIGMLLDLSYLWHHLIAIVLLTIGTILAKAFVAAVAAMVLRYPLRTSLITGFAIAQVGEFAFILSATGIENGLLGDELYQLFLSVSITTMALTPFVVNGSEKIVKLLIRSLIPTKVRERLDTLSKMREAARAGLQEMKDHLVIIGFGLNGRNVAHTADLAGIRHVVIEQDNAQATEARRLGHAVVTGDSCNEQVLSEAGVTRARVIVVAISDPRATLETVTHIRRLSDAPYVIVRTKHVRDIEDLIRQGANDVVPEEFETSIEIFARALRHYLVPENELEDLVNKVRGTHYQALRNMGKPGLVDKITLHASDQELAALPVRFRSNELVGKELGASDIKGRFGVSVLAIKRGQRVLTQLEPSTRIQPDDVLYVLGDADGIAHLDRSLRV
ncbi:MAG: cation:proton antiporter [Flavobacteriales bacterium]|nr:cation:proton antiporter [Flavobacteriales bacterium]